MRYHKWIEFHAYLFWEWRMCNGIPGSPEGDWDAARESLRIGYPAVAHDFRRLLSAKGLDDPQPPNVRTQLWDDVESARFQDCWFRPPVELACAA